MSLLDTLKNLICSVVSKKPESEQGNASSDVVEEKATEAKATDEAKAAAEKVAAEKVAAAKATEEKAAAEAKVAAEKAAAEKAAAKKAAAEVKPKPVSKPAPATSVASKATGLQIPEDSTLKRHFIAILKAEIESKLPPRPTDATLKRHYDAQVQTELDDLLG